MTPNTLGQAEFSRRAVLAALASLPLYAEFGGRPVLAGPAGREPDPAQFPRPKDLPVLTLDVAESRRRQTLVPTGGRRIEAFPNGCVLVIPGGVDIPVTNWAWSPSGQAAGQGGIHLVVKGDTPGQRPRLVGVGSAAMLRVYAGAKRPIALTLENLDVVGGHYGDAFRPDNLTWLSMRRVRISGGRNCMMLPTYPTTADLDDCEFRYGGFGDGQTHTVYVNYIKQLTATNCRFHSPKTQGHALKTYARSTVLNRCHIASWIDREDYDRGFGGDLPVLDIGAWGQSLITGNVFTRLPPARDVCIDFRNRQWRKGYSSYAPPDWGTAVVPFGVVDNGDPANPHLFRHFVANNVFENGVAPSGELSEAVRQNPGFALRNNGTAPWASGGYREEHLQVRPLGWSRRHERAIVWMWNNKVKGVPFEDWFLDKPYGYPDLFAPVYQSAEKPAFEGLTQQRYAQLLRVI